MFAAQDNFNLILEGLETKLNIRLLLGIMFTFTHIIVHSTLMCDNAFPSNYLSAHIYDPCQNFIWTSCNN